MTTLSAGALFLNETIVSSLLSWPLVYMAVDQALRSVSGPPASSVISRNGPVSSQTARTFTPLPENAGLLLSMPGYIGNYTLNIDENRKTFNTLACKLVTSFPANAQRSLPTILATIVLMDSETGRLSGILESTELTGWRTAAASLVATKHLYFDRRPTIDNDDHPSLAIVGSGVQGRYHAIGMCSTFNFKAVYLWNRTPSKAASLAVELESLRNSFVNPNVQIVVVVEGGVAATVRHAHVIVTATYASAPILLKEMLLPGVHINAIGAGVNHHSELEDSIYGASQVYVDTLVSAQVELATLQHPIVGEVGEVMLGLKTTPKPEAMTLFQSMGTAVEDAAVAQAVIEKYRQTH